MYNRYIPQSDGSFRKNQVPEPSEQVPIYPEKPQTPPPPPPFQQFKQSVQTSCHNTSVSGFLKQLLPKELDTGDLLVLLLLLLMAADCEEEKNNIFLTLAIYFFL